MLKKFLSTYNISSGTLKKVFPQYAPTIDDIITLEGEKASLSEADLEEINDLETNFVSALSSLENETLIVEYLKQNPKEVGSFEREEVLPEQNIDTDIDLGLSEEEINKSIEEPTTTTTIETPTIEAPLATSAVTEAIEEQPILIPDIDFDIELPSILEEPTIPTPSVEIVQDIKGWMMNDTDRLYYENFKLDTIQKLLTFNAIHHLNNSVDKREEIVSTIKNITNPDTATSISFVLGDKEFSLPIIKEIADDLNEYGFVDESTMVITPLGAKIISLYSKCFPLDTHPFSFVYAKETDVFKNASFNGNVKHGIYVNIEGRPFLYNGNNLFMRTPDTFNSDDNAKDEFTETLVNNSIKKSVFETCNASAYCIAIEKNEGHIKFNGGNGLGYVIFSSALKDIYVDSLTFNFLRYRFGADLLFSYDAQDPTMHIIKVELDGSKAGMDDAVIAYIVSDEKSVADFTIKTIGGNISNVDMLTKKIRSDYFSSAQFIDLSTFLDKNIMATEIDKEEEIIETIIEPITPEIAEEVLILNTPSPFPIEGEVPSIIGQETDLLGNKKTQYMFDSFAQYKKHLDVEKNKDDKDVLDYLWSGKVVCHHTYGDINYKELRGCYYSTIEKGINRGIYLRYLNEGRITVADAKEIIERAGFEVPQEILNFKSAKAQREIPEEVKMALDITSEPPTALTFDFYQRTIADLRQLLDIIDEPEKKAQIEIEIAELKDFAITMLGEHARNQIEILAYGGAVSNWGTEQGYIKHKHKVHHKPYNDNAVVERRIVNEGDEVFTNAITGSYEPAKVTNVIQKQVGEDYITVRTNTGKFTSGKVSQFKFKN